MLDAVSCPAAVAAGGRSLKRLAKMAANRAPKTQELGPERRADIADRARVDHDHGACHAQHESTRLSDSRRRSAAGRNQAPERCRRIDDGGKSGADPRLAEKDLRKRDDVVEDGESWAKRPGPWQERSGRRSANGQIIVRQADGGDQDAEEDQRQRWEVFERDVGEEVAEAVPDRTEHEQLCPDENRHAPGGGRGGWLKLAWGVPELRVLRRSLSRRRTIFVLSLCAADTPRPRIGAGPCNAFRRFMPLGRPVRERNVTPCSDSICRVTPP